MHKAYLTEMPQISEKQPKSHADRQRLVILVAFEGVEPLDVTGPMAVFHRAEEQVPGSYDLRVANLSGTEVVTAIGLTLGGTVALEDIEADPDTILVAGGGEKAVRAAATDAHLIGWLTERAPRTRRIGSICTGAFVLGAAGLLDGRCAATHWAAARELQAYFPLARVDADAIYRIDGPICTSAGVTAGIDLALALVAADLGQGVAAKIARDLVLFLHRPGGQRQFSQTLAAQSHASSRFADILPWIADNPTADLSVSALAARCAMSERNFARRFATEIGKTPARYVLEVRLDHARRDLELTDWPLDRVAERSGLGGVDTLHRLFRRELGVPPGAYRARFAK